MKASILYLAYIRLPTERAHGAQIIKTCEALGRLGVTVELLLPVRQTPISEDVFRYYNAEPVFKIIRIPVPNLPFIGSLGFAISALWFSEVARWSESFKKTDVIYSRDAMVLLQYLFLRRKIVYEAHTKPTFISKLVARYVYKLVVISEGLRDAYIASGVRSDKVIVAHDAIDVHAFDEIYNSDESRQWLGIPFDKKIALYVGLIDAAKGADTFAAASDYLPDSILPVLIGSGPLKATLRERYPRVLFLPETPYRDVARVLASADVLVLPNSSKDEDMSKFTSPLKAFAYLAARKPIVSSDVVALRNILPEDTVFFHSDDPKSLAEGLLHALSEKYVKSPHRHRIHSWDDRAQTILTSLR